MISDEIFEYITVEEFERILTGYPILGITEN